MPKTKRTDPKTGHTDAQKGKAPQSQVPAKAGGLQTPAQPVPTVGQSKSPRPVTNPMRSKTAVPPPAEPETAPTFDWRRFNPSMLAPGAHFADELTVYRDNLDELLAHEGEYVVIKGTSIVGIFPTRPQAIGEALDRFGGAPVLVKKIAAEEPLTVLGHVVL